MKYTGTGQVTGCRLGRWRPGPPLYFPFTRNAETRSAQPAATSRGSRPDHLSRWRQAPRGTCQACRHGSFVNFTRWWSFLSKHSHRWFDFPKIQWRKAPQKEKKTLSAPLHTPVPPSIMHTVGIGIA